MGRIYRRGDTYHAYWTDTRGTHHRRSLGTKDGRVAAARLRELELATADPAAYSTHTLGAALDHLFRAMVAEHAAAATIGSYQQKARHLERLLGQDLRLADVSRDRTTSYVTTRVDEGAHPSTIYKELVVLRRALKVAIDRGVWTGNPGAVIPKVKQQYRPRDRWLTHHEADAMLAALRPHRRLWAAIALYAGLRDSEVERLRWGRVDRERGWIRVDGTKTEGAHRMVPIPPPLATLLAEAADLAEARGATGDDLVVETWSNVDRDLTAALDRGLHGARVRQPNGAAPYPRRDPISPNDLRRTYASWLVQAGVPLYVVARLLGHTSTRMVERVYGHLATSNYQDAIDAMSARAGWLAAATSCATGVQDTGARGATGETPETRGDGRIPKDLAEVVVPRDGVEPPTRGFSERPARVATIRDRLRILKSTG